MGFSYSTGTVSGSKIGENGTASLIQIFKDYLVNDAGWTLTEDRSAEAGSNHKVILQSNGESGTASTFYLVMTSGTTSIGFQAATYWDTGTHTVGSGVASPSASTSSLLTAGDDKNIEYWLSGDTDGFVAVTKVNGEYDAQYFSRIIPFNSDADDPFPVYCAGGASTSVGDIVNATNNVYSFLDGSTALNTNEADLLSVYVNPITSFSFPGNQFGQTEGYIAFPSIAAVSDSSPDRRAIRGFAKHLWVIPGPATGSYQPEDIFDPDSGRTYQVFFTSGSDTAALLIRRT